MMSENDKRAAGLSMYRQVLGRDPQEKGALTALREVTVDHLYGSVWTRGLLELRERRLVTIALLAAQGHGDQLRDHLEGAISSGVPVEVLRELMVHVAHYTGWAAGTAGHKMIERILENDR